MHGNKFLDPVKKNFLEFLPTYCVLQSSIPGISTLGEIGGSDLPHYELESISTLYQVSKKLKALLKESLAPPEVSQLFN